jgi:hypothetical protein
MEFSFYFEEERDAVLDLLADSGFDFRASHRKNKYILYIKDSAAIEDFLVYTGASAAAFDVMNSKIVHEFRNSVNRCKELLNAIPPKILACLSLFRCIHNNPFHDSETTYRSKLYKHLIFTARKRTRK